MFSSSTPTASSIANMAHLHDSDATLLDDVTALDPVVPTYHIIRGVDKTLQFYPPVDSEELAIALSYHFPRPITLESKMQAAMMKYLKEHPCTPRSVVQEELTAKTSNENENQYLRNQKLMDEAIIPLNQSLFPSMPLQSDVDCVSSRAHIEESSHSFDVGEPISTAVSPYTLSMARHTQAPPAQQQTSQTPGVLILDLKTGQRKEKSAKRRYGALEARQVFQNRGNACERHRRTKSKAILRLLFL